MLLRTRLVLIFGAALLAMLAAVAWPLLVVEQFTLQNLAESRQEAQQHAWQAVVADAVTPYEILAAQMAQDPELLAALHSNDVAAVRREVTEARIRHRVGRIDIIGSEGRLLASSVGMAADAPLIDTTNLRSRMQQDPYLQGVETGPDGQLLAVVTIALETGHFLTIAVSAEPVLRAFGRSQQAIFLVNQNNDLLMTTHAGDWDAYQAARRRSRDDGAVFYSDAGRTFSAVSTPLWNTAGLPVATLISVQDVTASAQRRTLVLLITGGAAALVFGVLLFALFAFTKGALDPLSEVTRVIRGMAAGDAMVSADIPDRQDEVGAIAGAVEVFRSDIMALARVKVTDQLRQAQQQALIRREMEKLAGMLEETERTDLAADLKGIEAASSGGTALAEGFKRMAARVMAQHTRLADLLAERTKDLEVVRQALAERAQLTRLRQELELARHLQLSSLPQVFPPFPDRTDFEIYAAMEPAKEVGGDFFDFALIDGKRLAVMIGDASGKGVSAAMFIAMGRSILRSSTMRGVTPGQALALANSTLAVENNTMMFATAFLGVIDLGTGRMEYSSAGHNPPYLVVPGGGVTALPGRGIALGVIEDAAYDDLEVVIPVGANLVLFTDGVTEANDTGMALFGEARLEQEIAALVQTGPEGTVAGIQGAVRRFAAGTEQADDITVLAVRYLGPSVSPAFRDRGKFDNAVAHGDRGQS